jgi:6-phosphogluconolactonase (cycloisomerase 2 family)
VLVPDKGLDRIFSFRFQDGRLTPASQAGTVTREGAGPRHHAFHPRLAMVYVVNELDSTVTAYRYDAADGSLAPLQRLSTLPESFTGDSRAAGIMIASDGRTLYASNRGADSIAAFAIDPESGLLRLLEATSTQGSKPRFFTLNPGGTLLYALNEDSDTIVVFSVDVATGRLGRQQLAVPSGSPVCMVFA